MKILLTILNLILAGIGVDMCTGWLGFHPYLLIVISVFVLLPLFSIIYVIRKRPPKFYSILLLILNLLLLAIGVLFSVRTDWDTFSTFFITTIYLTSILNIICIIKNLRTKN